MWVVIVTDSDGDQVVIGPFDGQDAAGEWMNAIHAQRPYMEVSVRPVHVLEDGDDVAAVNKALDDLENGT